MQWEHNELITLSTKKKGRERKKEMPALQARRNMKINGSRQEISTARAETAKRMLDSRDILHFLYATEH